MDAAVRQSRLTSALPSFRMAALLGLALSAHVYDAMANLYLAPDEMVETTFGNACGDRRSTASWWRAAAMVSDLAYVLINMVTLPISVKVFAALLPPRDSVAANALSNIAFTVLTIVFAPGSAFLILKTVFDAPFVGSMRCKAGWSILISCLITVAYVGMGMGLALYYRNHMAMGQRRAAQSALQSDVESVQVVSLDR